MSESGMNAESNGLSKERFLFGTTLFFITLFLTIAVVTFDAADPPNRWAWPPNPEYRNTLGAVGAALGGKMLLLFGIGAYYILVSLAVVDLRVFGLGKFFAPDRQYRAHAPSFAGWLLSLIGLTALATVVAPHLSPGPVIGSGGCLGIAAATFLEKYIAATGTVMISIFFFAAGLILCASDEIGVVVSKLRRLRLRRRSPDETEEEEHGYEYEEDGPPIKTASRKRNRKRKKPEPEEAREEPEIDEEETEWEEVEEETTLRIRKPKKTQRQKIEEEIDESTKENDPEEYELPSIDLLQESELFDFDAHEQHVRDKARILESTFADFGFTVRVVEIQTGPVISQFEIQLEAGLRLSRITGLADDLAIALKVPSVRIVAPIPGKNTVGIEVPNSDRQLVRLREVIEDTSTTAESMRIPVFLGKDVSGAPLVVDLAKMPHLLIAGRTGTGKSVCLNSIIVSILMSRRPDEVRMLMIDPKMVELSGYKRIPHLMHPVVTDMRKAEAILGWAVDKMEERYALLARVGVRNLESYNQLGEEEIEERLAAEGYEATEDVPTHMPYVVIIADEMADLMMTAAKEVEAHIIRLAQKSRAVGIHLVLATQKPTVDVITGLIKSNLPARISFQVASRTDSRVVLDEMGADKLLGNGDMLFLSPSTSSLLRGQGTYLSDEEINRVIGSVATSEPHFVQELVQLQVSDPETPGGIESNDRDDLYPNAVSVVVREGRGSVSLLQRALGIGYGRAARLIDYMAEDGIIGPYNGSQAREVLITLADWEAMQNKDSHVPPPPEKPPKRNRVVLVNPADEPEDDEEEMEEELAPWEEEREAEASEDDGDWEEEESEDADEEEYEEEEWEYEEDTEEEELDDEEYEEEEK